MRYLRDNLNRITARTGNHRLFLFLDYDGTLTPIVETPQQTKLASKTRTILHQLSENPGCKVAIISGRSLKEIKKLVRLKNIIYVGNHGFQVDGPNGGFTIPLPRTYRQTLEKLKADMRKKLALFEGVRLEDKDICLAVHYRLVAKKHVTAVKSVFNQVAAPAIENDKIRVTAGKKVFEIRPPVDWHKGRIVAWLLRKSLSARSSRSVFPIYIGDDLTDEDAFKILKNTGLTIVVGKTSRSNAQYFVRDTDEVIQFLKMILKMIRLKSKGLLCPS